jgi:hypothetical protein
MDSVAAKLPRPNVVVSGSSKRISGRGRLPSSGTDHIV